MTKPIFCAVLFALTAAAQPAFAQGAEKMAGNCAVYLDEMAKTIDADVRFTGDLEKRAVKAMKTFSKAQQDMVDANMAQTYRDSEAFGWDKAKVDAMMKAQSDAVRAGFQTSTMEDDRVYMDHVMAVNNCAEINKADAGFGQSRDAFIEILTEVFQLVRKG